MELVELKQTANRKELWEHKKELEGKIRKAVKTDKEKYKLEQSEKLKHPNIVEFHEFHETKNSFYICNELLEGEELKS